MIDTNILELFSCLQDLVVTTPEVPMPMAAIKMAPYAELNSFCL